METEELEELDSKLQEKYFLIRRGKVWQFGGGVAAFLFAAGLLSWSGAKTVIEGSGAAQAAKEIGALRDQAEMDARVVRNTVEESGDFILSRVPSSAVVAFDAEDCPDGWKEADFARGRFIIGVGEAPNLTPRSLKDSGGDEEHALRVDEMPEHSHDWLRGKTRDDKGSGGGPWEYADVEGKDPEVIGNAGEGKPHKNMPPFVALLFCERE